MARVKLLSGEMEFPVRYSQCQNQKRYYRNKANKPQAINYICHSFFHTLEVSKKGTLLGPISLSSAIPILESLGKNIEILKCAEQPSRLKNPLGCFYKMASSQAIAERGISPRVRIAALARI